MRRAGRAEHEGDGVREAGQAQRYDVPAARGGVRTEPDHGRPGPEGDLHVDQGAEQRPPHGLGDGLLRRPQRQEVAGPRGVPAQFGALGRPEGVAQEGGGRRRGQVLGVDPEGGPAGAGGNRGGRSEGGDGGDGEGTAMGRGEQQGGQPRPGKEDGPPPLVRGEPQRTGFPAAAHRDGVPQQRPPASPPRGRRTRPPPHVHRPDRGRHAPVPGVSRRPRRHGRRRTRAAGRGRSRAGR